MKKLPALKFQFFRLHDRVSFFFPNEDPKILFHLLLLWRFKYRFYKTLELYEIKKLPFSNVLNTIAFFSFEKNFQL